MSANAGCQYKVECFFLGENCISADQTSLLRVQWKFTLEAFVLGNFSLRTCIESQTRPQKAVDEGQIGSGKIK